MYSLERRRDRYEILYIYKIIFSVAPNFDDDRCKIKTKINAKRGFLFEIPPVQSCQGLLEYTDGKLPKHGPK